MTDEERRKQNEQAGGSYFGSYWVPGNTAGTPGTGPSSTTVPPPPTTAGGGAGTSYGPGVSGPANDPGNTPPPPPIQPYTSDSSAETLRAAANPERQGGGYAGTGLEESIYPPPPPVTTAGVPGALPEVSRATAAPKVTVGQAGPVTLAPPPTVNAAQTEFAGRTQAGGINVAVGNQNLQNQAATAIQGVLAGGAPSVAEQQARAAADRAAAEQLSIAAGARGRNFAAANRTAAQQIAQLQQQAGGQGAQLRAAEQATAREQLGQLATAARGQDIDVAKTAAQQKLTADIASDERLQGVLTQRAQLKQAADQGNQDAAVKLQTLQGQIDAEMQRFNAQQLQNASAEDAANYLKAVGLDDAYVAAVKEQWLQLQQLGQNERLAQLRAQVELQVGRLQHDPSWWDKYGGAIIGGLAGGIGGFLLGGPAGAAAGAVSGATSGKVNLPVPGTK